MKTFKLPKEFTEKWLKALKSGKYEQGTEQLVTGDNKYCCLGVACSILGINDNEISTSTYIQPHNNESHYLDEEIYNSLLEKGIPIELTGADNFTLPSILSNLNDNLHYTKYLSLVKQYPNLVFNKIPEENKSVQYSFKDIVKFIKTNVELY
jgi:hypothetical protein